MDNIQEGEAARTRGPGRPRKKSGAMPPEILTTCGQLLLANTTRKKTTELLLELAKHPGALQVLSPLQADLLVAKILPVTADPKLTKALEFLKPLLALVNPQKLCDLLASNISSLNEASVKWLHDSNWFGELSAKTLNTLCERIPTEKLSHLVKVIASSTYMLKNLSVFDNFLKAIPSHEIESTLALLAKNLDKRTLTTKEQRMLFDKAKSANIKDMSAFATIAFTKFKYTCDLKPDELAFALDRCNPQTLSHVKNNVNNTRRSYRAGFTPLTEALAEYYKRKAKPNQARPALEVTQRPRASRYTAQPTPHVSTRTTAQALSLAGVGQTIPPPIS